MSAAINTPMRRFIIELTSGSQAGQPLAFAKPSVFVGRGPENDIVFAQDLKVSRLHLEIRSQQQGVSLHNLTEKNPVLVNGQSIRNIVVDRDSRVQIGDTEFWLKFPGQKPLQVAGQLPAMPPPPAPSSVANMGFVNSPLGRGGKSPGASAPKNSRLLFYSILGVVVLAGVLFFSNTRKPKPIANVRTTEDVEKEVGLSRETVQEVEKRLESLGRNSPQYALAQQQYVRGFRDYRVGQYGRAVQSLKAAIAFFPQHELARRYLSLAQKKLDEVVKAEMALAVKYRGQGNFRMCVSAYEKVLRLIDNDSSDANFKEATAFKQECEIELRDHY